jgi:hypothetical protein
MRGKVFSAEGVPPAGAEQTMPTPVEPVKKSRKKLYELSGVVVVAAVLIILVIMLSVAVPQGLGETIPYVHSYTVGQKLLYGISATVAISGQQVSETGTYGMHIVSFDGENYTIDENTHMEAMGQSRDTSVTVVMNKNGQTVSGSNLPSNVESVYSMMQVSPNFGLALNATEIKVGETIHVPLTIANSTFSMSGTMNIKVDSVENITVPAGTYKTFKLEVSTSDLHVSTQGVDVSADLNMQVHLEYGTWQLVDLNMKMTTSGGGSSMSLTMNLNLTSDTTG